MARSRIAWFGLSFAAARVVLFAAAMPVLAQKGRDTQVRNRVYYPPPLHLLLAHPLQPRLAPMRLRRLSCSIPAVKHPRSSWRVRRSETRVSIRSV